MIKPATRRFLTSILLLATALTATAEPMRFRVILFSAADEEPNAACLQRLREYVLYTEDYFTRWMKHWGYAPKQSLTAERDAKGRPAIYAVKGRKTKASGAYDKPNFQNEVKELVRAKYGFGKDREVWWVFIHEPGKGGWGLGGGNIRRGGWSWAGYYANPKGTVRPGTELGDGIMRDLKLKGGIHELGHAFGLPHIGPRPEEKLGNSLMGPTHFNYARRQKNPQDQRRIHLSEAAAAILHRHPLFSGDSKERDRLPKMRLAQFSATKPKNQPIKVSGRLATDLPAHSVIICNYTSDTVGPYWQRMYVGKVARDGSFKLDVFGTNRARSGKLMIMFCFNNGAYTADGKGLGFNTAIIRPYTIDNGTFRLGR